MTDAPPKEWRDALGHAFAIAWHADQRTADDYITGAWKTPSIAALPPADAAAACISVEKARDAADNANLLVERKASAYSIWREEYIREWTWLVNGECDFEGEEEDGMQWLNSKWKTEGFEDPAPVALRDFHEQYDAMEQERLRKLREARLWKPPAD